MSEDQAPRRIPVFVVLPPQTLLLDVAGPLEVLRVANRVQQAVRFEVRYFGPQASVITSIGIRLQGVEPLPETLPSEAVVVLSGNVGEVMAVEGDEPEPAAKARGEEEIVRWLRTTIQPGHKLISICSGAVLAGRAGLLDGRMCTTHYACCELLLSVAPKARVLENRLYVEDANRYTSAGVAAGIDLMLYFVHQLTDTSCVTRIARQLVVYLRRGASDPQLSPWLEGRNHLHPAVHRVQDAVALDPSRSWTLNALARVSGASSRHLSRLFHEHAGMSVIEYRNRLRVAHARELLSQTSLDMEHVAERAGFASSRQLRRMWRRFYPTAPSEARHQNLP